MLCVDDISQQLFGRIQLTLTKYKYTCGCWCTLCHIQEVCEPSLTGSLSRSLDLVVKTVQIWVSLRRYPNLVIWLSGDIFAQMPFISLKFHIIWLVKCAKYQNILVLQIQVKNPLFPQNQLNLSKTCEKLRHFSPIFPGTHAY